MPLKSGNEAGTIFSRGGSHFEAGLSDDGGGNSRDQYSYGWSFILATLGFLGSELSALLCLAAFLNRFDSEEDFIKMLPGMERRLTGMVIQETINSNSIFDYISAHVCRSSKAWAV
jgi:hypothetical protein